jgi:microcin C transport system substrate-binding protein
MKSFVKFVQTAKIQITNQFPVQFTALFTILVFASFLFQDSATAAEVPKKATGPNVAAPKGGNFIVNLGPEPPTLHPITSTDGYSAKVRSYVVETLLTRNATTYDWEPQLAEKWEISKDGKVFTFFLRPKATFHDGKPVTTEDVKFSLEAIFDPKYEAAHLIPYFDGIDRTKTEIVNPTTIKFVAKNKYYKNFDQIAELLQVIPKHIYSDIEKSKKMNSTVIGSGPYQLDKFERGQRIVLKRYDKWAGAESPNLKGYFNFDTIDFKFIREENVEIERIKKGDLDYIALGTEAFMKKTEGPMWGKTVFKKQIQNSAPKDYGFIAWNLRRDLFKDRQVRQALAHLMNREEMNKKFRFGQADLATGPVYLRSEYANPKVKPFLYDPKAAKDLLTKAGWADTDKDGALDKIVDGKKTAFKFALIYSNKDTEKYWTIYKEDLKKAGIEMELKFMEWNSFIKTLDGGDFDGLALSWTGGSVDWDPKQVWHSSSAVVGGSNFIDYKNPEVDKLIDEARETMDKKPRIEKLQKAYEIIAMDAPYVFLFNNKYLYYAISKRIDQPGETFEYETGSTAWWMKK